MEETLLQQEALPLTRQNMLDYFNTHDVKYVAEDAIFRDLSSGHTYNGKAEIGGMLHFMYHVAFDAKLEIKSSIITEEKAQLEGIFKGRHIGEIEGIPPTNKEISVPISVSYELKDGLIQEARIYFLISVLLQQLGILPTGPQKS